MEIVNLIIQGIAAVASVFAALAAWQALRIARKANELAEKTALESSDMARSAAEQAEQHARDAEIREEMRDQRRIASNMQAWWVRELNGAGRWGVILSNTGPDNSVFHNVCLKLTSNSIPLQHEVKILPPGTYFLESSRGKNGKPSLNYPESVSDLWDFQPLLNSRKHAIEEITFVDQVGQGWRWVRGNGLAAA